MKPKLFTQVIATASAVLGAIILTSQLASANTTFQCVNAGNKYSTIAVSSSGKETRPLLDWDSVALVEFIKDSEQQCLLFAERLNRVVSEHKGKVSDLLLTTGVVRGHDVVCWVNDERSSCNYRNILIVFPPLNYPQTPETFLRKLVSVPVEFFENGNPFWSIEIKIYLRFGEAVERELTAVDNSSFTSLTILSYWSDNLSQDSPQL